MEKEITREDVERTIRKNHEKFKADMVEMSKMESQEFREETMRQLLKAKEDRNDLYEIAFSNLKSLSDHQFQLRDKIVENFNEIAETINPIVESFKIIKEDLALAEDNFKDIEKKIYATDFFLTHFAQGVLESIEGKPLSTERRGALDSFLVGWKADGELAALIVFTGQE